MTALDTLNDATPAVRAESLRLLDEISRPMTVREIEKALQAAGNSRSWSKRMANQLRGIAIIAIIAEET